MKRFKLGVIIDSFKTDIKTSLRYARELGAEGIQVYATDGEMSPENLKGDKKQRFIEMVKGNDLNIAALCGDLGRPGFTNVEDNKWKIQRSKEIIYLAVELGTNIVTTHIGVVPENKDHDRYKIMQDACFELSIYADTLDAHFAIETGPETAVNLKQFLDSLKSKGVAVNLDPANLIKVTGDDPVQAVYTLKDYIVHTHAKDGIMLFKQPPEEFYGLVEKKNKEQSSIEVPLGEGNVDFHNYLIALDDIGYDSYLTIEREVGENPKADIKSGAAFLNKTINNIWA